MKRIVPFPLAWTLLVAMWLVLNETLALGSVVIGALVALAALRAMAAVETPRAHVRSCRAVAVLFGLVVADIVRSNVAVARIVLRPGAPRHTRGFLDIPLELNDRIGLAVLACIVTATPGTAWAGYDDASRVLTLHVLDLVDPDGMREAIKRRYESPLREIFE